jgi:hypothetical protein
VQSRLELLEAHGEHAEPYEEKGGIAPLSRLLAARTVTVASECAVGIAAKAPITKPTKPPWPYITSVSVAIIGRIAVGITRRCIAVATTIDVLEFGLGGYSECCC